jgi:2-polyprenyl-3-methyl-5-hydroxy-6-metoxy-1,4-benzoquinol methylase
VLALHPIFPLALSWIIVALVSINSRHKDETVRAETNRWNHNLHYHPVVLKNLPQPCTRVLDVGCGEGTLTRQLRLRVPQVVGIDLDVASIELARKQDPAGEIQYLAGDFLIHPFKPQSFDAIVSVAALHHMDAAAALTRMRDLLRPGGSLVIVGLAPSRFPSDIPLGAAALVVSRMHRLRKGYWEHPSPTVWPPPLTYAQVRALAAELLPGCRFRRHLLWRYSLTWSKPG